MKNKDNDFDKIIDLGSTLLKSFLNNINYEKESEDLNSTSKNEKSFNLNLAVDKRHFNYSDTFALTELMTNNLKILAALKKINKDVDFNNLNFVSYTIVKLPTNAYAFDIIKNEDASKLNSPLNFKSREDAVHFCQLVGLESIAMFINPLIYLSGNAHTFDSFYDT